jgi:hypothetical protein
MLLHALPAGSFVTARRKIERWLARCLVNFTAWTSLHVLGFSLTNLIVAQLLKIFATSVAPEGTSPCSQETATGSSPETDKSIPFSQNVLPYDLIYIILPSTPRSSE